MGRVWADGPTGATPISAARLNAMEADIEAGLGVPDAALAGRINDTTPSQARAALNAAVGQSFGSVFAAAYGFSATNTPAGNLTALQNAAAAAISAGVKLVLPAGTVQIAGGHVTVNGALHVQGASAYLSTIHQTSKAKPVFKVTAADCSFTGFKIKGAGLDVTGHPLFGADSFRAHAGIWGTLGAHRLSVADVDFEDIVIGVYIKDYLPGETPVFSTAGAAGFRARNLAVKNVWCGIEAGPLIDHRITDVTGTYGPVTGTPTNGDTASPPHTVYINSDATHRSRGGFIDNVSGYDVTVDGGPVKVKHSDGFTIGKVYAHNTRSLAEFEECADFEVQELLATACTYPDAWDRGAVWLTNSYRGRVGVTVRFAAGTHGRGLYIVDCDDIELPNTSVYANRTTVSAGDMAIVRLLGNRHVVTSPNLHSAGALMGVGIHVGGTGTVIIGPKITGSLNKKIAGTLTQGLIDYDPVHVLASRAATGTYSLDMSAATADRPILRDRSVGQAAKTGFVDLTLNEAGRAHLAHTDGGKLWQFADLNTNSPLAWLTDTAGAYFNGASTRGVAYVEGGAADGTFQFTVGALPANGLEGGVVRFTDINNYVYATVWVTNGDYRPRLYKRVGGAATLIATAVDNAAAGDVIKVVMAGTSVSVLRNDVEVIAAQTISDVTGTKHGLLGASASKVMRVPSLRFDPA